MKDMLTKRKTTIATVIIFVVIIAVLGAWWRFGGGTTGPVPETQAPLGDGRYLGYLRGLDDIGFSLVFDDAVWLTGKAGEDAAIEAGHCTEATRSECLPNDYFIKNAVASGVRLPLDPDAQAFMQTWKMEETGEVTRREIGLAELAGLINDAALHWRSLPYDITVRDGVVVTIEEVYIP